MTRLNKDMAAGIVFAAIALIFGLHSMQYELGNFFRMGPGLYPLVISVILFVLGCVVFINGLGSARGDIPPVGWRAVAGIVLAPIVFALTVKGLGLVLSATLIILIGAYANRGLTVRQAAITVATLLALCIGIFVLGLKIPIALFGPWLGGN